jgi:hypothetical protein
MHWRWGASAGAATSEKAIVEGGRPSDLPVEEGTTLGSLLIDPLIWIQSIRVAVVLDDSALDPNASGVSLERLSHEDWGTLFAGRNKPPGDISGGANIVCWYSTEVHRELTAKLKSGAVPMSTKTGVPQPYKSALGGTVFVHGIFFAHEAEMSTEKTGDTDPLHWPKSESAIRSSGKWFRDAS